MPTEDFRRSLYYEKDLTNNVITTYYYLGDRLVAKRAGSTLSYIHQDHLGGTDERTGPLHRSMPTRALQDVMVESRLVVIIICHAGSPSQLAGEVMASGPSEF